jgi:hypothetical protein
MPVGNPGVATRDAPAILVTVVDVVCPALSLVWPPVVSRSRRPTAPAARNQRAVVANTPTGLGDRLTVTLDVDKRTGTVTPVDHWSPNGETLPTKGDKALVTADDYGYIWVTTWVAA